MLNIQNLHFSYRKHAPAVLSDFSIQFDAGEIIGLLGKNGTGKSTLLYLIAGLLRPQQGSVTMDHIQTCLRRPETLRDIFILPEEFELPSISLEKYVSINRPFYPLFSDEVLRQSLEQFDLTPDLHLAQLSMGQRKKAFVSFALATNTRLLLMDEPTNGLDIPSKSQFRRVVSAQMNEDRSIIVSTHQVHDVATLIDRVVMLSGHRLLLNTTMQQLSEWLCFEQRSLGADTSDALHVEATVLGQAVISLNDGKHSTPVDLELLFSGLTQQPDLLQKIAQRFGNVSF